METFTISLDNDAYERLEAEKREGESFSDVVIRLAAGVDLADYHGVLSTETADEIAAVIDNRRRRYADGRTNRLERINGGGDRGR